MGSPTKRVPDFVTHYYFGGRPPFQSLSDLAEKELAHTIRELDSARRAGAHNRVFGRRYMELRRLTEERLHQLFVERGGVPERATPHYFVLGSSEWYRGLAGDMKEVRLSLSSLPVAVTSFTYPDSFTAMGFAPDFGIPYEPRDYHGKVFLLDELEEVIGRHGLPADDPSEPYEGYEQRPFEKYVEVQLWSDVPTERLRRP
jgi:hypothetical protein